MEKLFLIVLHIVINFTLWKNHWHGVVVFITACLSGSPQFKSSWVPLILCAQRKRKGGDGKQESGDGKQESGDGKAIFDEIWLKMHYFHLNLSK